MLAFILAAQLAATAVQPSPGLAEAAHAIEAGRIDHARIMVNAAVSEGATGDALDRVLADLTFAERNYVTALARYEALFVAFAKEVDIGHDAAGRLGILPLGAHVGEQPAVADPDLDLAADLPRERDAGAGSAAVAGG